MVRPFLSAILASFLLLAGICGFAKAQVPRASTVLLVVPFPAGSASDKLGRAFARAASRSSATQVEIVNRPGKAGALAIVETLKGASGEPPRLLLVRSNMFTDSAALEFFQAQLGDPVPKLTPVVRLTADPYLLVTNAEMTWTSLTEFLTHTVSTDTPTVVGFAEGSSRQVFDLFREATSAFVSAVPFRSDAELLKALQDNQIAAALLPATSMHEPQPGPPLRVLATTDRTPQDGRPTFLQAGYKQLDFSLWVGLFLPEAAGEPILAALQDIASKAARDDMFAAEVRAAGFTVSYLPPPEFKKFWQDEKARHLANQKAPNIDGDGGDGAALRCPSIERIYNHQNCGKVDPCSQICTSLGKGLKSCKPDRSPHCAL